MTSGGHTAEMVRLLATLDFARYTPRVYLVSSGDAFSAGQAARLEAARGRDEDYTVVEVPRARRVHQSFLTAPWTTLMSLAFTMRVIALDPRFADVVIMNGPGTCVPICLAVFAARVRRRVTLRAESERSCSGVLRRA